MNSAFSQYFTKVVPAGQQLDMNVSGSAFKCRKCSVPAPTVTVAFDGGPDNPISHGDIFDLKNAPPGQKNTFSKLTFKNSGNVDATVTFFVGNFVAEFGQDNSNPSNYPKGNCGFGSQNDINAALNQSAKTVSIVSPGSGYSVGDILTVSGGTGTAVQLQVTNILMQPGPPNTGKINSVKIVNAGSYSALPSNPVSVTGGAGTNATFNLTYTTAQSGVTFNSANGGSLNIASNAVFTVPNLDNGHQRAQIVFTNNTGSPLLVMDLLGRVIIQIVAGSPPVTFTSDSQFLLQGNGGTAVITIGELYYSDL